jgi:XTP/dITP diphosphohydrolase
LLEESGITLCSLNDYANIPEMREDGLTFLDNALKKARTVCEFTGETALADDSGIEVDALDGRPGILSARYAGPNATDEGNNRKLLEALQGVPPERRGAAFRCFLVLCRPDGSFETFEGSWRGRIGEHPQGKGGFGYDPVFHVPELGLTAAQLSLEVKNSLSHRAQAFRKLKKYLQTGT